MIQSDTSQSFRKTRILIIWAAIGLILVFGILGLSDGRRWSWWFPGLVVKWTITVVVAGGILATLSEISAGIVALRRVVARGLEVRVGWFRLGSLLYAVTYIAFIWGIALLRESSTKRHEEQARAFFEREVTPIVSASEAVPFERVLQEFKGKVSDPDPVYQRDRMLFRYLQKRYVGRITSRLLVKELRKDPELAERYSLGGPEFEINRWSDYASGIEELTAHEDGRSNWVSSGYHVSGYISRRKVYLTLFVAHQHNPLAHFIERFDSDEWTLEKVETRSKPDGKLVNLAVALGLSETEPPTAFKSGAGR
jgi:hypothetical protein